MTVGAIHESPAHLENNIQRRHCNVDIPRKFDIIYRLCVHGGRFVNRPYNKAAYPLQSHKFIDLINRSIASLPSGVHL